MAPTLFELVTLLTEAPAVIADPDQAGEHGRWTTAADVLTQDPIVEGAVVVAGWGTSAWSATARWDGQDLDTLWLTPHVVTDTKQVLALLASLTGPEGPDSGVRERGRAEAVLALAVALRAIDRHRAIARRTLAVLERLPEQASELVADSTALVELAMLGRRRPLRS